MQRLGCYCLCLIILELVFCPLASVQAGVLRGTTFLDLNQNAASHYAPSRDSNDLPWPEQTVILYDGQTETVQTTNADGHFVFRDLAAGAYYLFTENTTSHVCTTKNRAIRTPQAIREGLVRIVTYGDSIGVEGAPYPYPERVADHFAAFAEVTLENLAIGGSRTTEWLPASSAGYFETRVVPTAPNADIITITIGGNDLDVYIEGMPPYNIWQIILNFLEHPEYLFEIVPNIRTFISEIRTLNPNCDIVYVVYPNFTNSSYFVDYVGEALQPLASLLMGVALTGMRLEIGNEPSIILADMFGLLGNTWLDPYMVDFPHPSDAGHQLYADAIFTTLGGAIVGEHTMGYIRHFGFFAPTESEVQSPELFEVE